MGGSASYRDLGPGLLLPCGSTIRYGLQPVKKERDSGGSGSHHVLSHSRENKSHSGISKREFSTRDWTQKC